MGRPNEPCREVRWSAASGQGTFSSAILGMLLAFLVSAGVALVRLGPEPGPEGRDVVQPVVFNHLRHVEEEGLECLNCHQYPEREARSGLPPASMCALCHSEMQGESEAEAELVRILESGAPLEWQPLFQQPPHVYYSHRRHVAVAGLECVTCHGDIGSSERPPDRATPMSMEECTDCHERQGASNDCTACHR